MPRDATGTRARLLDEAERLFATKGIFQTTSREIMEAAQQKNASAVTYHFGTRSGLLLEILRRHGDPLDEERGRLVAGAVDQTPTRDLVTTLLVPYVGCLSTRPGRYYLRIVAQLTEQFPEWRGGEVAAENLQRILDALEDRVPADPPIRRQRVVSAIILMTSLVSERARRVEEGAPAELDDARFTADLADMIVAVLEASVGPPLRPAALATLGGGRVKGRRS